VCEALTGNKIIDTIIHQYTIYGIYTLTTHIYNHIIMHLTGLYERYIHNTKEYSDKVIIARGFSSEVLKSEAVRWVHYIKLKTHTKYCLLNMTHVFIFAYNICLLYHICIPYMAYMYTIYVYIPYIYHISTYTSDRASTTSFMWMPITKH
jgi:hypothetical protein